MLLATLASLTFASGCTTFSDDDAVARVGDTELGIDELQQRAVDAGLPAGERLDPQIARTLIAGWIQETATSTGLFDPATIDIAEDEVSRRFDRGLEESGVICPRILIADTVEAGDAVVSDLRSGATFDEVFAEANIDPSLDAQAGRIGCLGINDVASAAGAPEVAALYDLDGRDRFTSEPILDPLGEPAGSVVIAFTPYADLDESERQIASSTVQSVIAVDDIDVKVNSRYGYFDPVVAAVVPLG